MVAVRLVSVFAASWLLAATSGCSWTPRHKLASCESQNRALVEQTRAQFAELDNLRRHSRDVEEQLRFTEDELAMLRDQSGIDGRRLANYERERQELYKQFQGLAAGGRLPQGLSERLEALSKRYPSLHYDPATGISKFDTDILFPSAEADLRPEARQVLDEFAELLKSPEARNLKLMIVGHTDDQAVAKRPIRERFRNNWHLSTSRALAVADRLRQAGVPENRMGVAGFGEHQPVASNNTSDQRRLNRRVEIFVLGPETPVVGWTESITNLY